MKNFNSLSDQLLQFLQNGASTAQDGCVSFIGYLQLNLNRCKRIGKTSAANKLQSTYNRFVRFLNKNHLTTNGDFLFSDLTSEILISFERSMKEDFLTHNTTSFYLRILRSYYNKGIREGLYFSFTDPFKNVYTGISRTKKRAIEKDIFIKLKEVKLPDKLNFARDIFLFSFFMRGMSFVDISKLTSSNIFGEELKYCRTKTGQTIRIRIEPCARDILNKYIRKSGDEHLFPIVCNGGKRLKYNTSLKNMNNHLKKISRILGLEKPITTYTARHSWASIAKKGGIPISTISEGMGHTSERTTMIYLSSLNQSTIDDANRLIIRSLNQRKNDRMKLNTKL